MDKQASRQFDRERSRTVRQAFTFRREPVFFVRIHLAECPVESIGTKKRIVAEPFVATRRPHGDTVDTALELFDVYIGRRCSTAAEMRGGLLFGYLGAALDQQFCGIRFMAARKILVRPRPARGMDTRITAERIDDQSGIVRECYFATRARRGFRLDTCIGRERLPVSSGSDRPRSPADCVTTPNGASNSRISFSLPGL